MQVFEIIRILILAIIGFCVAMAFTPLLSHFLYKYSLGKQIRSNKPVFHSFHLKKEGTPTMGGILIWGTVLILAFIFWLFSSFNIAIFRDLNFLDRGETFLPIGIMVFAALVGLGDDLLGIFRKGPNGGGMSVKKKLVLYLIIAAVGSWWFYFKLDWDLISVPFFGNFNMGLWYIPAFIFVIVATAFSANETDGLDGLLGGVLLVAFLSLGVMAFSQGRFDLAAFCGIIIGATLAFLWFNIYPARFFMGDTGSMSLGITLGVIAMLTNTALLLPFIASILFLETLSVIIQFFSKKIRGRKLFYSTPIHHHFEAMGWPETKITMRFWIISGVMAFIGVVIGFVGQL